MKLYIQPNPIELEDLRGVGGIWSVIRAQGRWLPEHGVELVETPEEADIINTHAGEILDTDKPIVTSSHGLYWTADLPWGPEFWQYNNPVVEALRRAHAIITPSNWVAYPIKRDMRRIPHVIPHGIDGDMFGKPKEHQGYVLWAKPRIDVVSSSHPMNELAHRAPKVQFVSTFGRPAENVKIIGRLPFEDFQLVMSTAAVWLATTRETGDIASREAMAQGIPVLGWNWGGTAEFVRHKETGWLAEEGDYEGLLEGLHYCLEHRDRLGSAARDDVLSRFQWKDIMARYAAVYSHVLDQSVYPVDLSIIVPAHNYAHYLPECLQSIEALEFNGSMEVIIVDDASTDNTQDVLSHFDGLKVIRHPENMGLPMALNTGHRAAAGRYITNLDADNTLTSGGMQVLYDALEAKPWVDVATGHYQVMGVDRIDGGKVDVWQQMNHYNQIPSTCLIRSRSVRHLGGYRRRQVKNEDAEFWCRGMAAGLRCENVTGEVIFNYRWHEGNKTKLEGGEDDPEGPLSWNFYCPWRKNQGITPFAMLGNPPKASWPIRSYTKPHISVVIPCGPGHEKYLMDALDSVAGQTFTHIECVVANDTGKELDLAAMGHPWVRVIQCPGGVGPAIARNTAIAASRAPLIVPLDADDMLYPSALGDFYAAWVEHPDSLVYMDCETEEIIGKREIYYSGPWTWEKVSREAIYQDTILFAKQWWEAVGGYPTDQPFGWWEDWLFGVLLHLIGVGATYVRSPWGVYRHWTAGESGRSKNDIDNAEYGSPAFKQKYHQLLEWIQQKEQTMPCRGCGGNRSTRTKTPSRRTLIPAGLEGESSVIIVYEGERTGGWHVNSKAIPGRKYRISPRVPFEVPIEDAWMMNLPGFRRVDKEDAQKKRLPEEPQSPPVMQPDTQQPAPVVAEPPPVLEPPTGPGDDGLSVLSGLGRVRIPVLKKHGLDNIGKVKVDVMENGGKRLLKIPGIGLGTVGQIRRLLSA